MSSWMVFALGFMTCLVLNSALSNGRDSTDGPRGRSGMRLHTDQATGLQYLSAPFGGITPRLGLDGKQMRAEDSER